MTPRTRPRAAPTRTMTVVSDELEDCPFNCNRNDLGGRPHLRKQGRHGSSNKETYGEGCSAPGNWLDNRCVGRGCRADGSLGALKVVRLCSRRRRRIACLRSALVGMVVRVGIDVERGAIDAPHVRQNLPDSGQLPRGDELGYAWSWQCFMPPPPSDRMVRIRRSSSTVRSCARV